MTALSPSAPALTWDYATIIAKLGGTAAAMRDTIQAAGHTAPAIETLYMWKQRQALPAAWMPAVLGILAKRRVSLASLIVKGTAPTRTGKKAKPAARKSAKARG